MRDGELHQLGPALGGETAGVDAKTLFDVVMRFDAHPGRVVVAIENPHSPGVVELKTTAFVVSAVRQRASGLATGQRLVVGGLGKWYFEPPKRFAGCGGDQVQSTIAVKWSAGIVEIQIEFPFVASRSVGVPPILGTRFPQYPKPIRGVGRDLGTAFKGGRGRETGNRTPLAVLAVGVDDVEAVLLVRVPHDVRRAVGAVGNARVPIAGERLTDEFDWFETSVVKAASKDVELTLGVRLPNEPQPSRGVGDNPMVNVDTDRVADAHGPHRLMLVVDFDELNVPGAGLTFVRLVAEPEAPLRVARQSRTGIVARAGRDIDRRGRVFQMRLSQPDLVALFGQKFEPSDPQFAAVEGDVGIVLERAAGKAGVDLAFGGVVFEVGGGFFVRFMMGESGRRKCKLCEQSGGGEQGPIRDADEDGAGPTSGPTDGPADSCGHVRSWDEWRKTGSRRRSVRDRASLMDCNRSTRVVRSVRMVTAQRSELMRLSSPGLRSPAARSM